MPENSLGEYLEWNRAYGASIARTNWECEAVNGLSLIIVGQVLTYAGSNVQIPQTRHVLKENARIATLHLESQGNAENFSLGQTMVGVHAVVNILPDVVDRMRAWKSAWGVRFVIAASNDKLIRTVIRAIPAFKTVGKVEDKLLRKDIIARAAEYSSPFGDEVASGSFPIVAATVDDFMRSAKALVARVG